jgi:hypothetical protein
MMISGGDYSPNSHTFFKHPFTKDGVFDQKLEQIKDQRIIVLNKCPKDQKSVRNHNASQSAQFQQRKNEIN